MQDDVVYAEANYRVKAINYTPNDEYFDNQWGMHNTGQTGGVSDADIDAPEAWDVEQGSNEVVVGVIDSGIDYNHPDLIDNMWTNPGEIPDNGVDDDGNGYVDDYYGYNFNNDTGDPWDDMFHGTHCAGIIAASGDNGIGVAGVSWNTKVAAIKWIDYQGFGQTFDAVESVMYANMMDFDITNNSWHIYSENNEALRDAISISEALFVNAAGNSWWDLDLHTDYPTSYDLDNMLTVAATDYYDILVDFPGWWGSNYGLTTVDVGAPGFDIYSTAPNNQYAYNSGTSMASPYVAGIAALLLSKNSNLHWSELKEIIMISSDPQPDLEGKCVTGARVNAFNALMEAGTPWLTLAEDSGVISFHEGIKSIDPGTGDTFTLQIRLRIAGYHYDLFQLTPVQI
jgi:subtilisin family serine protease